jgi:hypothetical protein
MTVESSVLAPGARLAGRYVVEQCIRATPVMQVYVARAETASSARFTARVVAHPHAGGDAVGVVNRELQRVAMLKQRAVPTLVAVARDPAGLVVLTERPEGPSLREHLAKTGRFRPNEVARMIAEVAMVLDALHAASPSIVHRALSPDQIAMADRMLRLWVEECGLAQALTTAGLITPRTSVVATAYLSPGEMTGYVSPAGDLFSLASVAYECLVGAPAFAGADDAAIAAAIRGGARPSAAKERGDVPPDVDTVLHRAWGDEQVYGTAGAFARELSRVLLTNPAARGAAPAARPRIPVVTGTRERQVPVRPPNNNKTTLLGLAPGAGDRPTPEETPMKSTLLGLGSAPRGATRPAAPANRAAPLLHPPTAPAATAEPPTAPRPPEPAAPMPPVTAPEITEGDIRPRIRRPTETTQRVEVPRIRPPGTEPIQSGSTRVKVPLAMGRTISSDVRAEEEVTVTESGEQPVPLQRLSAGAWGEIEASLGVLDDNDLEAVSPPEVPPAPTPMAPPSVDATAPTVPPPEPASAAMFDLSDSDFDPVVPATRVDATPAPAPIPDAADSISIEPELGAAAPVEPPVAVVMPPTPIAPAMADPPPMPTPVPPMPMAPMPMVQPMAWTPPADPPPPPQPSVPRWAPMQSPPSDPTVRLDAMPPRRGGRMALVAGLTVLVAGVAAAAGWFALHKDRPTDQPTPIAVRRPTPRAVVAARDAGAEAAVVASDAASPADATQTALADAVAASDVAVAVAADAAVAPDAAVVAAAAVDAGAPEEPTEDPPGGTSEPPARLHSHPRAREIGDFIDALTPAVQRCVSGSERHRRVRVGVVWEGRTGRATEVQVGSTYAAAPMGPCLESAVRGRPITPFTDRDFETSLVFEAR